MKHKRTKRWAPATRSAAWLFSALAVLVIVISPLFAFAPAAHAQTQAPGDTGLAITAKFIDSNHIAVVVSGSPTTSTVAMSGGGSATVDWAYLEGIYVATDNVSPYPTGYGSGSGLIGTLATGRALPQVPANEIYQLNGSTNSSGTSVCGSKVSQIILNGDPQSGNLTANVQGYLPSVTSASAGEPAGQCINVGMSSDKGADMPALSVTNPSAGGQVQTFLYKDTGTGGDFAWALANKIPANSSAVIFYQANSGEIDAAAYDPAMGTDGKDNPQGYTFTSPVTETSDPVTKQAGKLYSNGGGYYKSTCVDKIFVPNTAPDGNGIIKASYEQCDPNGPNGTTYYAAKTFPIMVLGDTPENIFNSVVTALGGTAPKTTGAGSTSPNDPNLQCTAASSLITNLVNFVICPLIDLAWNAAVWMDGWITSQMQVDVSATFDTSSCSGDPNCKAQAYYTAWNSFRILATGILVIAGLIMVVSQALGFEMFDAYTVRKVLPRLLIATIGISLSWPLMRFVVGFFDTLGQSVQGLMYAPFAHVGKGITPGANLIGAFALGAGILALGFASLTFAITALLAVFVGFVILILRQIAITMLIILAPVAIACYILPNTQKVWKLWYDNFLGLMLMYPIIEMLIAAGHIFSALTQAGN